MGWSLLQKILIYLFQTLKYVSSIYLRKYYFKHFLFLSFSFFFFSLFSFVSFSLFLISLSPFSLFSLFFNFIVNLLLFLYIFYSSFWLIIDWERVIIVWSYRIWRWQRMDRCTHACTSTRARVGAIPSSAASLSLIISPSVSLRVMK